MKTFRELISWELEQEKKGHRSATAESEDQTGKLGACMLRKIRHLHAAPAPKTAQQFTAL